MDDKFLKIDLNIFWIIAKCICCAPDGALERFRSFLFYKRGAPLEPGITKILPYFFESLLKWIAIIYLHSNMGLPPAPLGAPMFVESKFIFQGQSSGGAK